MNHEIAKTDFFYIIRDDYDEHAELAIPFYRLMHEELVRLAPPLREVRRVLDLGCGTGKTAAVFLQNFPESTVKGIDLFEEMLKHARTRLGQFGDRVQYVTGDFREVELGGGYDVCVSALAIHHSTADEKARLFERVYESLAPGGRFLLIDWTKFSSPSIQAASAEFAEEHARASVPDEGVARDWAAHWREKNIPDTVEDMTRWLRDAGFAHAECVVRCYGMALICAEKET